MKPDLQQSLDSDYPDSPVTYPAAYPRRTSRATPISSLERWLLRKLIRDIGDPPLRIVLWDGEELFRTSPAPRSGVIIHGRGALHRLLGKPSVNFCQEYCSGDIEIEGELLTFLELFHEARQPLPPGSGPYRRGRLERWRRLRGNSPAVSRDNIHHHYDLGNDFYRLWLDREMQYTCAYFPDPAMSLEAAQIAKVDHICRKLQLQPGETVVEAGCGWGGTALHMARRYGVRVRAFNISREQLTFARERAAREGLADRVAFLEDDYRNISGRCDAFVSVGMLEHVGKEHFHEFGDVIDRVLAPGGRGLIHSIGQKQPEPLNPWIEKHLPRRLSAHPARDAGDPRTVGLRRRRCGKPAPALCPDAGPLAGALQ